MSYRDAGSLRVDTVKCDPVAYLHIQVCSRLQQKTQRHLFKYKLSVKSQQLYVYIVE